LVSKTKFLGIIVDENLEWKVHIHLCKRSSGNYILKVFPVVVKYYNSTINTLLSYQHKVETNWVGLEGYGILA